MWKGKRLEGAAGTGLEAALGRQGLRAGAPLAGEDSPSHTGEKHHPGGRETRAVG